MKTLRERVQQARLCLFLATLLLAISVAPGCDTVADIVLVEETLDEVTVVGLRCLSATEREGGGALTCTAPSCFRLDFVLETTKGRFMVPDRIYNDLEGVLTPGTNFGSETDDIQFAETFIFQLDDTPGDPAGSNPRFGMDKLCSSDADCKSNFRCQTFSETDLPAGLRAANVGSGVCAVQATVTPAVGSLKFTALGDDPQPDNSTGTEGRGFSGARVLAVVDDSASHDGIDVQSDMMIPNLDLRTDPRSARLSGLTSNWLDVALDEERSSLVGSSSQWGLLSLPGDVGNQPVDYYTTEINQSFVAASFAQTDPNNDWNDAVNDVLGQSQGRAGIWDGLLTGITLLFGSSPANPGLSLNMLLITDGVNEAGQRTTFAEFQMAVASGLSTDPPRTDVVQLDSALVDLNEIADPMNTSLLRKGPQADYSDLACETGGHYYYAVFPDEYQTSSNPPGPTVRLGKSYEGVWSVEVNIEAAPPGATPVPAAGLEPGWYRVAATMTVQVGSQDPQSYTLDAFRSALAAQGTGLVDPNTYIDSRLLFRVPQATN